ncbi:MAG: MauE/DoxX family redox-associated membrane protein [Desulfobacteria bacterium]
MSEKDVTSSHGAFKTPAWRLWTPRLLSGALGLVLLAAGLVKAMDMELFIRQIMDYGIVSERLLLILSAWGLIALECALGVALLVFYRPRPMLSLTAALLLIFAGATGWAWLTGVTEDCGCYGAWLKQTPGQALVGDLVLLAATAIAWAGCRHVQAQQTRTKAWAVIIACLIGLGLPAVFGVPTTKIEKLPSEIPGIGPIQVHGLGNLDLNKGEYLIVLMGTACFHCQEAIPDLNILCDAPDLPPLIALCTSEEADCIEFVEEFQPIFPIGHISDDLFWRLLADGDMPRIILLHNGHIKRVWDQTVPNEDAIKAELSLSQSYGGSGKGATLP